MSDKKDAAAPKKDVKDQKKQAVEEEEFEEFPVQDWDQKAEGDEDDVNVWEDNWDDETHEQDFSKQLKEELARHGHEQKAP